MPKLNPRSHLILWLLSSIAFAEATGQSPAPVYPDKMNLMVWLVLPRADLDQRLLFGDDQF